ncbi:MAG TPA: SHOCT domain-containing protein [Vicinamibacteria bacterium]
MGPMEHPYFWWGGMWLFPALLLAAVVFVTYLIVRQGNVRQHRESPRPGAAETRESPMEIVKRRYAQGEISREDFLEMKKDLAD